MLRELGVWSNRPATRESAEELRRALEELGTTCITLGQLLSSRPDLVPDVYIEELGKPVNEIQQPDAFVRVDPEPLATASTTASRQSARTSWRARSEPTCSR